MQIFYSYLQVTCYYILLCLILYIFISLTGVWENNANSQRKGEISPTENKIF